MCGIAGVYSSTYNINQHSVDLMLDAISHRGPDSHGVWTSVNEKVCLGHRRLSILDLSDSGSQPMISRCGRYTMVFNGEIYNYVELRSQVVRKAVRFTGTSDTEVLLSVISHYGLDYALTNSIGMFAIALWDNETNTLCLTRDRAGKKPLYYSIINNQLLFSSEIKSFKTIEGITLSINNSAVSDYLSLSYIPGPQTIYKEILEVIPGQIFEFSKDLDLNSYKYWELPTKKKSHIPFDTAVNDIDSLLSDSINLRLRSDVPIGIFLSGGIDSGLITAYAATALSKQVNTYTVGFEGSDTFDETGLAQLVADRYKTNHKIIRLSTNIQEILPKVVDAYDEPFGDPSAVPTFAVSAAAASEGLKVILNGEGSDELFGGYRRHMAVKYSSLLSPLVNSLSEESWDKARSFLPTPKKFRSPYAFVYRFISGYEKNHFARYMSWTSDTFSDQEKAKYFTDEVLGSKSTVNRLSNLHTNIDGLDNISQFMAMDFLLGMADGLLVKMDIATMAHGIEARSPFLDHRIIEYITSLDRKTVFRGTQTKPILRKLSEKYLPNEIVTAPKRGFELPVVKWMKGDIFDMTRDLCMSNGNIVSNIMNPKSLIEFFDPSKNKYNEKYSKQLWLLLMLSLWGDRNQ